MKITHGNVVASNTITRRKITAADDFDDVDGLIVEDDDAAIGNQIDTLQDKVEDIQDTVDDVQEDDSNIEIDNNIANHYIAECDKCHGIFISAMIESDQDVDHISGKCPLCQKESDQLLKWVIHEAE